MKRVLAPIICVFIALTTIFFIGCKNEKQKDSQNSRPNAEAGAEWGDQDWD